MDLNFTFNKRSVRPRTWT